MEEHFEPPEMQQMSPLAWLLRALGFRYTVFLPFIAILALVLAIIAIGRFKTPVLTALLLAVVPLPLFYGAMAMIDGMMASMQVIMLSEALVKPSELAEGGSLSLVSLQVGLVLSLPVYVLSVVALAYRALTHAEVTHAPSDGEPPIGATLATKG
jgi:hypothetical protein